MTKHYSCFRCNCKSYLFFSNLTPVVAVPKTLTQKSTLKVLVFPEDSQTLILSPGITYHGLYWIYGNHIVKKQAVKGTLPPNFKSVEQASNT